jgi:hypothetical protein
MEEFNARIGNNKSTGNIGTFGETTCNNNGVKLRDLVLYNDLKIMNIFFQHKHAHKYIWSARGSRSIIDYIICNQKTANLILDVRVYRGPQIETDHYLVASPLRISPRWYKRKQQTRNSDKIFKINHMGDPSIRWLFKNRVLTLLQQVKISSDIEEEWGNLTYILEQAATKSIGLRNKWHRKKGFQKLDEYIEKVINEKRLEFKKYLSTQRLEDEVEYKRKRAISKREVRKRHREMWDNFVARLERDVTKPNPPTFKILKKLRTDIRENVKIHSIKTDIWLDYFKNLWSSQVDELIEVYSNNKSEDSLLTPKK